jgi:hypothetical protein
VRSLVEAGIHVFGGWIAGGLHDESSAVPCSGDISPLRARHGLHPCFQRRLIPPRRCGDLRVQRQPARQPGNVGESSCACHALIVPRTTPLLGRGGGVVFAVWSCRKTSGGHAAGDFGRMVGL